MLFSAPAEIVFTGVLLKKPDGYFLIKQTIFMIVIKLQLSVTTGSQTPPLQTIKLKLETSLNSFLLQTR